MRRLVTAVNTLIVLVLAVAAGAFYWFLWRALPETSGTVKTAVAKPVDVQWDALGVPHIRARSIEDALYIQGYVTASQRMFQMDALRRLAAGELSEVIGAATLETDRESRRLRMRRSAEQIYVAMDPSEKALLAAYARGVNAWIEAHRGRYGLEFMLLRYDPRPWSVVDSLLAGLQMFRNLTSTYKAKLAKGQMIATGEKDKVEYLLPVRSGQEFAPGSNAWAVAGAHTASGKPIVANDMHLDWAIPSTWFMAHLQAPGLNVSGVSLPGLPGVIVGHNDRIAWGFTNLGFYVMDLYVERLDLRTGQYAFQGHVEQARREREVILVKGAPPQEVSYWVTRHGPVILEDNGRAFSLSWTASDPRTFHFMFLDLNRARNWAEFRDAFSRFGGPGQNVVYADVDGNIGYQATGKLPLRNNYPGDVPVDGSSGQNEWLGYIPFDDLPRAWNPPSGYIVTANQNPFPRDYKYPVSGGFAPQYRSQQIRDLLMSAGKIKPEDSLRIEKDVYSGFARFLAAQMVTAYTKRNAANPAFNDAVKLLRTWDGQMDKDRPEPLIVTLTFQYIRRAMAERASPGNGELYDNQMSPAVVENLLRARPEGWFADYDELIIRSLADAMDEGKRMQGADITKWKWGKYTFLDLKHPIGSRLPLVSSFFNVGPWPMSGSSTTVKQTSRILGPSERMDVSVGDWENSLLNITVGQSGHVASSNYKDEAEAYYNGRSFPMQFNKVDAKSTVHFVP
jgi:penicillin amidase